MEVVLVAIALLGGLWLWGRNETQKKYGKPVKLRRQAKPLNQDERTRIAFAGVMFRFFGTERTKGFRSDWQLSQGWEYRGAVYTLNEVHLY